MEGWAKLWRKSLDTRVFKNAELWQLWTYCLMKANHKDNWVMVKTGKGDTEVLVKKGEFIFGRNKAAKELNQKPFSTYKRILKLKTIGNITIQNNTHYSIISICNWETYQGNGTTKGTTKGTPKEQPRNTNKNVKNDKKYSGGKIPPWVGDSIKELFSMNPQTKTECTRFNKLKREFSIKATDENEIREIFSQYRKSMPRVSCTPEAVLKHWDSLKAKMEPEVALVPMSPEEEKKLCLPLD